MILLLRHTGWRTSWAITPGDFDGDGQTDLLLFDPDSGEAEFYTTDDAGRIELWASYHGWRSEWAAILAGQFDESPLPELLFYDDSTGEAAIYTVHEDQIELLREYTGWRETWQIATGHFLPPPEGIPQP